ncbi:NAD(P)H-dependent oxidoreductase [Dactylosporangium aurantiacum]|uniref:FMN dependent NADH:quinone oxidoreductase n=1 Tax=Dactylosporangium aurantiacum TaxID=35754 RepID=A0A9Q9IRR4_9ACTN|nr:NAD(P)H-dependent oxidoreductase [Dactylosporangium aurantiacum]MDG6107677.1 NAD(P)H-dependent oxidoreductase [Dactylosporangium aurantiacum]UWZ58730.1 NAD(P)H-dependent oxidoreductase [Dactylosporangium aurantiacum]
MHLLHLDSSARREGFSRRLSARYAEAWRAAHPDGRYTYRDLVAEPVPCIDEAWTQICDIVLAEGITDPQRLADVPRTYAQRRAWKVVEPLLTELVDADELLLGVPMYNYSVPASLKAWIDQVTFPRARLDARVVVAGARGGSYGPGTPREPFDHHERYLRDFLAGHFGIHTVRFLTVEMVNALIDPTLAGFRELHEASLAAAWEAAAWEAAGGDVQ